MQEKKELIKQQEYPELGFLWFPKKIVGGTGSDFLLHIDGTQMEA